MSQDSDMRARRGPREVEPPNVWGLEQLPEGWTWTTTETLFSFVTSGSRGWAKYYSARGPLFLRIGNLNRDSIILDLEETKKVNLPRDVEGLRTKVKPGDILLSITADLGMVALIPDQLGEAYINQHIALTRPMNSICGQYLAWYLTSDLVQRQWRGLQRGATKIGLGLDDVTSIHVALAPLPEQERIVAEIEKQLTRLDAAIAALESVQAKLKRYRASVLKTACEGRLVPTEAELARAEKRDFESADALLERVLIERRDAWEREQLEKMERAHKEPKDDRWKAKYKEPSPPDVKGLTDLPEGWTWATVEQINFASRPCAYGVLQPGDHVDDGVPLIRVGDIDAGQINQADLKLVAPEIAARYPRTRLYGGEVLITLVGTIGRTAVVPESLAGANTARAVGVMSIQDGFEPEWIEVWFRNPAKILEMVRASHEVARRTLNLEDVRSATVAAPPQAEQLRIVDEVEARLSVVDKQEAAIGRSLARAIRLRQSILKRAFEGKLVPQDPNDEPASVLLERIRSERKEDADARPKRKPRARSKAR